ncbi:unnamed protein product [Phytophthora lilii]|uniref:Unnamed protein product n=1 Tax=Phytophthora lilii TaxID=2077276 RepID=A0A9W6TU80_9STRA|nr:unnamed protein product [Phytophthora lilii]
MLSKWVKQGVSADEAYNLLKIGDVSDNVLGSTQFASLVKYVDEFNAKNSGSRMPIYNTLNKKFGLQRTAQMIYEALAQPNTRRLGERLQVEQLHSWMKNGILVDEAYKLLKLEACRTTSLKVDTFGFLVKVLDDARTDSRTRAIAQKFQTEYLKSLQDEGNSADEVFKMFGLNKRSFGLLDGSGFSTWTKYVKLVNKENPDATMTQVLRNNYDQERLTKLLERGKTQPESEPLLNGNKVARLTKK